MDVRDLMTTDVVTVQKDTPLKEAAGLMSTHSISGMPVLEEGKVVGILSEADFVRRTSASKRASLVELLFHRSDRLRNATTVGEIMTTDVATIAPQATHVDAARIMGRKGVKRLPVVDQDGRLLGMVSRADILRVFTRPDGAIEQEIRHRIMGQVLAVAPDAASVTVQDGRVTLEGTLNAKTETAILTELAGRVDGVISVESQLGYLVDDTERAAESRPAGAPRPNW